MTEHNKTERLFDAIGCIDDRLIAEAQSPKAAREHIKRQRRMTLSSLAVACVFTLVLTLTLSIPDIPSKDSAPGNMSQHGSNTSSPPTLEYALLSSVEPSSAEILPVGQIDLHDGKAKLIWSVNGEEGYRVCTVSKDSKDLMIGELTSPSSHYTAEAAESISVKVWLYCGDGIVVSPYLEYTPGNVGFGVLFDYEAEVEPSSKLTNIVNGLIDDQP